jgi:hypothetical protein
VFARSLAELARIVDNCWVVERLFDFSKSVDEGVYAFYHAQKYRNLPFVLG